MCNGTQYSWYLVGQQYVVCTLVQYVQWYTIFLVSGWSTIYTLVHCYFDALVLNILHIWLANMYILWYNLCSGTQYSWYLEHCVDHNTDFGEKLTPDP